MAVPASAWAPSKIVAASERMQKLGILRGRPDGTMGYMDDVTRAEAVTILVRALGREEEAQKVTYTAFSDTEGHWANGYIAMGKEIVSSYRYSLGEPDGRFRPDDPITPFELLALILKFVGVTADGRYPWPDNYYRAAVTKGVVEKDYENFCGPLGRSVPATRGCVIQYADRAFTMVPINLDRQSVYEYYHGLKVSMLTVYGAKEVGHAFTVHSDTQTLAGMADLTGQLQASVNGGKWESISLNPRGEWTHVIKLTRQENRVQFHVTYPNYREELYTLTVYYEKR